MLQERDAGGPLDGDMELYGCRPSEKASCNMVNESQTCQQASDWC